jgi:PAS domain S-box-containing protein
MDTHAIVVSDAEGRIQVWNTGAEKLFGYSAAEAIGQLLDLIIPERFRERHWAAFHAAIRAGESKLHNAATELPVLRKDGSIETYPARFLFLKDGRERAVGAMALYSAAEPGA